MDFDELGDFLIIPPALTDYAMYVILEDWEGLGSWLNVQTEVPSLFEALEVPPMNDPSVRAAVFQTPKVLQIWTVWHVAMVFSYFHKKNFEVVRDTGKPMDKNNRKVESYFKEIFLYQFDGEADKDLVKAVQTWMLINNKQLMPYVIQNLFWVAEDIENIVSKFVLPKKERNQLRFTFEMILRKEAEIKAIPEFGQFFSNG